MARLKYETMKTQLEQAREVVSTGVKPVPSQSLGSAHIYKVWNRCRRE